MHEARGTASRIRFHCCGWWLPRVSVMGAIHGLPGRVSRVGCPPVLSICNILETCHEEAIHPQAAGRQRRPGPLWCRRCPEQHQDRQYRGAVGRWRHGGHQLQERRGAGGQGNQRRWRHPGQEDRVGEQRHPVQPRRGQGPDAKSGGQRGVCHLRPGVLGLHHGQHGRKPPRRGAQLDRWRGRRHHAAGQPVRIPHQLHPGNGDAEGGEVHRHQVQEPGDHVREQRLRQRRPGLDQEGAERQPHQDRR